MLAVLTSLLAAAGGGSGGYGGGGGGGFSGGGGSGGSGGSMPAWMWLLIIAGVIAFVLVSAIQARRYRRRRLERAARVRAAAAEAATDDEDFLPATVEREAARLFRAIQGRWTARDRAGLAELVGPDLMEEWARRLDDFERKGWHNVVEVSGDPEVEYLGLVNREGEHEDRVVVRISATTQDYVRDRHGGTVHKDGETSTTVELCEWWTLQPPGERWRLVSIEQEAEGRHHLESELVAVPWAGARVHDDVVVEQAAADAVPAGVAVGELADPDLSADARAAALDLALVDGRFAPDVLTAAVRRAVAAWVEAVDGDDAALEALAAPEAVDALLHGGDRSRATRVVVRGARVAAVEIAALDAEAGTMAVDVQVRGLAYVEDRDTTDVVSGSKEAERKLAQRWTFALGADPATPWRLVAAHEA